MLVITTECAAQQQKSTAICDGMHCAVLGINGFGRSDLSDFFEVNRYLIAHAALAALAKEGKVSAKGVARAIRECKLDPGKPNLQTV
ncbi:hypothetical protein GCM10007863_40380 [Dyella mobilis]|uniref:Uncharacterized protein n=1 Tax=Dyella mobilis TaxID=1849582 RepID=A0ABS2KBC6_9GAMM|nr:hypothetical protein [Dyella mobilis]MBM7128481.1 hypothetical protein [Dyella mobilis]GLQ99618.1 hypothetical protein GCM10007863_40380 [Dyella mobilis]